MQKKKIFLFIILLLLLIPIVLAYPTVTYDNYIGASINATLWNSIGTSNIQTAGSNIDSNIGLTGSSSVKTKLMKDISILTQLDFRWGYKDFRDGSVYVENNLSIGGINIYGFRTNTASLQSSNDTYSLKRSGTTSYFNVYKNGANISKINPLNSSIKSITNSTSSSASGYGHSLIFKINETYSNNYSVTVTPTLQALSPTTAFKKANIITNATNYYQNLATMYYIWSDSNTFTTILKNATNATGKYFDCSSSASCYAGKTIYVKARAVNATAKSSYSSTLSVPIYILFNATARNFFNNSLITNYNLTINSSTYNSPTSNLKINYTTYGNFVSNISRTNYALQEKNFSFSLSTSIFNITYYLYPSNKIFVYNIYDERNGKTIANDTITATAQATTNLSISSSATTTNGKLNLSITPNYVYQVTFTSTNYATRTYYITIPMSTSVVYPVYLAPNTAKTVTIYTRQNHDMLLPNSLITAQTVVNKTLVIIAQKYTDITGGALLYLIDGNNYILTASNSGYTTVTSNYIVKQESNVYGCAQYSCVLMYLYPTSLTKSDPRSNVSFILLNGTTFTPSEKSLFKASVTTSQGNLIYYGLRATINNTLYQSILISPNTTYSSFGGYVNITLNTSTVTSPFSLELFFKQTNNIEYVQAYQMIPNIYIISNPARNLNSTMTNFRGTIQNKGTQILMIVIFTFAILAMLIIDFGFPSEFATLIIAAFIMCAGYYQYISTPIVGILILALVTVYIVKRKNREMI